MRTNQHARIRGIAPLGVMHAMKTGGRKCRVKIIFQIIFHMLFLKMKTAPEVPTLILRLNMPKSVYRAVHAVDGVAKIIIMQIHPDSIALYNALQ